MAIERTAADCRLEIEADDRDDVRDAAAMVEERRVVGVAHRGKAEQNGVIADRRGELRFSQRLPGRPTTPATEIGGCRARHQSRIVRKASSRTGRRRPISGRRISNCVV